MSIIDKLKGIKDQLPKTVLNEKVQKENNNLKDQIKAEIKPEENEENNTHPGLGPAKEDYILLNTFSARFEKADCFIKPDQIFIVTKPSYDISNSKVEHEFKISFTMVDAKHYFGKPSEYTNFKLDQEIIDLVNDFNQNSPEWFEFSEHGDDSDIIRVSTRYYEPKITKIEFPEFNTMIEGVMKYYTATISYDRMVSINGEKFEE
jgi:hypothetical protein